MAQEIKMSAAGLKAMQEELEYLKTVRRKELAEEIIRRVWWRTASPNWSR